MANKVNVNFTLDSDVKEQMESVCSDLGITLDDAFTIFAEKVCQEKKIPFDYSFDLFYSKPNLEYLQKIVDEVNNGKAEFSEHELIEE